MTPEEECELCRSVGIKSCWRHCGSSNPEQLKPIHKFNNGRGATLCLKCNIIVDYGFSDRLYCEKCKP